ncbi:MAG: pilus assembly PilX N-terminal domain-containing protein [Elusimicrobia bacterium]|nr:pilus assembly PilX N-terminal domain-containing protein [Elusimicrobiota bacterium]
MILNNKGSLLPVAVASMLIIMVAGLAVMKLFSMQNLVSVADRTKLKTYYAAEGAIEYARYHIDRMSHEDLFDETSSGAKTMTLNNCTVTISKLSDDERNSTKPQYIREIGNLYNVYEHQGSSSNGLPETILGAYKIRVSTSAVVENHFAKQTIETTLTYFFVSSSTYYYKEKIEEGQPTTYVFDSSDTAKKFVCWRKSTTVS